MGRTTAPRIELEKVLPETAEFQLTENAYEALIHKEGRHSHQIFLPHQLNIVSNFKTTNNRLQCRSSHQQQFFKNCTHPDDHIFRTSDRYCWFQPFTPIRSLGRQSERL